MTRVVQWATGAVGGAQLRAMIDDPDLELVGLFVYSPAAGEHPGFMFERLATSVTGLCQRVDRITAQEFVDCSGLTEPKMLVELMGMGKQPEAFPSRHRCSARCRCSTSRRSPPRPTRCGWRSTTVTAELSSPSPSG